MFTAEHIIVFSLVLTAVLALIYLRWRTGAGNDPK